jgi:outer membrane biogenesis lipoprotein LolB
MKKNLLLLLLVCLVAFLVLSACVTSESTPVQVDPDAQEIIREGR